MVEKHLLILSLCAADLSPYLLMRSPIYMWFFCIFYSKDVFVAGQILGTIQRLSCQLVFLTLVF